MTDSYGLQSLCVSDTWVTAYLHMGNHFSLERVGKGLEARRLLVERAQVVAHEGHEPDLVVDLLDADLLTGKDLVSMPAHLGAGRRGPAAER